MTIGNFVAIAVLLGLFVAGFKMWQHARAQAEEAGDDPNSPLAIGWQVFILAGAAGIGLMAGRAYLLSIPKGDHGFGGILYLLIAGVIVLVAFGAAAWGLGVAGRDQAPKERLLIGLGVTALVVAGLVWPMMQANRQQAAERAAQGVRDEQQKRADAQLRMAQTPHAPVGEVPPQLEVQREGQAVVIGNRSGARLEMQVQLVLPREGGAYERCALGVEAINCGPEAGSCTYSLAKDGTKVVPQTKVRNTVPQLAPGEKKTFTHACEPRFASAALEYRLYDIDAKKSAFQSASAFAPNAAPLRK